MAVGKNISSIESSTLTILLRTFYLDSSFFLIIIYSIQSKETRTDRILHHFDFKMKTIQSENKRNKLRNSIQTIRNFHLNQMNKNNDNQETN